MRKVIRIVSVIDEKAFGELLRYYRKKKGISQRRRQRMTQKDLADCAGLTQNYISFLETGRYRHPKRETVLEIARCLQLDQSETNQLLLVAGYAPETDEFHALLYPSVRRTYMAVSDPDLDTHERELLEHLIQGFVDWAYESIKQGKLPYRDD
jgi:transcriptional regulator with XRE-family HTH domain